MAHDTRVKICGLRDTVGLNAAVNAGAAYVGLVFFEKSPRNVTVAQAAELALQVPVGVAKVALVVNADDAALDAITASVPLDFLQLHGSESPERTAQIKARYGLPVMKAIGVASAADLTQIAAYETVADQILLDAKPPRDAKLPGGNGHTFDWGLIAGRLWTKPWMLAGGLTIENVGSAIAQTGTRQIDLSSGVESAPGVKDPALIAAFIAAAQGN
jgi:phosphoribosylanthranilate isomerase